MKDLFNTSKLNEENGKLFKLGKDAGVLESTVSKSVSDIFVSGVVIGVGLFIKSKIQNRINNL